MDINIDPSIDEAQNTLFSSLDRDKLVSADGFNSSSSTSADVAAAVMEVDRFAHHHFANAATPSESVLSVRSEVEPQHEAASFIRFSPFSTSPIGCQTATPEKALVIDAVQAARSQLGGEFLEPSDFKLMGTGRSFVAIEPLSIKQGKSKRIGKPKSGFSDRSLRQSAERNSLHSQVSKFGFNKNISTTPFKIRKKKHQKPYSETVFQSVQEVDDGKTYLSEENKQDGDNVVKGSNDKMNIVMEDFDSLQAKGRSSAKSGILRKRKH
ncbi:unnamed protein product [Kuraishia capsulata CBS 1993]|uniref:Uncharacterized protein n=1 Tax=Kuraishia capsulata CBS 1993 TaxID=1382522 RepID=W6MFE5_9ASCO|nr:uncharacterized protein KUCA_T00000246001 [Kuraishia capsulata CBS 1993]CDK24286.1 unnamed protein product [Kuraishia capsulata CBS 1993]